MPARGIAALAQAGGHRLQGERRGIAVGHLVPLQRRRHPRVRRRAYGVGGGGGAVLGVLVVVDEDAVAFFLPPGAGRQRRLPAFHFTRQRQRRPPHVRETPAPFDAHVEVHPARTGCLGPGAQSVFGQHVPADQRRAGDVAPRHAGHRIQIDAQLVRVIQVVGAHQVRMQIDAPQVHQPDQLRDVADHHLHRRPPRGKPELDRLDPVRPVIGRPLLIERRLLRPIHIPLHHDRPPGDPPQRSLGDVHVVADEIQLRVPGGGEVDLVRVGDRHLPPGEQQRRLLLAGGLGHRPAKASPASACGAKSATAGSGLTDDVYTLHVAVGPQTAVHHGRSGPAPERDGRAREAQRSGGDPIGSR